jgi:hypothetical protein
MIKIYNSIRDFITDYNDMVEWCNQQRLSGRWF